MTVQDLVICLAAAFAVGYVGGRIARERAEQRNRKEAVEDFKARRTIQDCGWPEDKP